MKLRGTKDLSLAAVGKYGTLQEFSFFDKVRAGPGFLPRGPYPAAGAVLPGQVPVRQVSLSPGLQGGAPGRGRWLLGEGGLPLSPQKGYGLCGAGVWCGRREVAGQWEGQSSPQTGFRDMCVCHPAPMWPFLNRGWPWASAQSQWAERLRWPCACADRAQAESCPMGSVHFPATPALQSLCWRW